MRILTIAATLLLTACSSGGQQDQEVTEAESQGFHDRPVTEDYILDGSEMLRDAFLAGDIWSCQATELNIPGTIIEHAGDDVDFSFSVDVDNGLFYLYTQFEIIATNYRNFDSPRIESWGSWHIEDTTDAMPIDSSKVIGRGFHKDGTIRIPMSYNYTCSALPLEDVRG